MLCLHNESITNKGASMKKDEKKAIGALARAEKLTPERRTEIAKEAASARWGKRITHQGKLNIIGMEIPCYVTEDGIRVLSGRGLQDALKLVDDAPKSGQKPGSRVDRFLGTKSLKSLIYKGREPDHFTPLKCTFEGAKINGYRAEVLSEICEAMLQARDLNLLDTERQRTVARQCDLLMRAFALVGIVALVDEATGYQDVRDRQALQAILDAYLRKELAAWAKRFPDEFYKEMFRLKEWGWNPMTVAKPGVVGRYTLDIVYERLAPELVTTLEKLNPKNESGHRKAKHHQWLSSDVGHPALAQHIHAIMGLMRVSKTWDQFMLMLNVAFPKKGQTIEMNFE